eukprot:749407-Hanusia_phi.AAC.4
MVRAASDGTSCLPPQVLGNTFALLSSRTLQRHRWALADIDSRPSATSDRVGTMGPEGIGAGADSLSCVWCSRVPFFMNIYYEKILDQDIEQFTFTCLDDSVVDVAEYLVYFLSFNKAKVKSPYHTGQPQAFPPYSDPTSTATLPSTYPLP